MRQGVSAKEMEGVHSGEYCEVHGIEKMLWNRDPRSTAGGHWRCMQCNVEARRRTLHKQKVNGGRSYAGDREKNWRQQGIVGLTYEHYQAQATHCRICGTIENLVADHDHTTHQFRGVLCASCNKMLGNARDNPVLLRCAELYLGGQSCW